MLKFNVKKIVHTRKFFSFLGLGDFDSTKNEILKKSHIITCFKTAKQNLEISHKHEKKTV